LQYIFVHRYEKGLKVFCPVFWCCAPQCTLNLFGTHLLKILLINSLMTQKYFAKIEGTLP